jgi:signal transduction histidine kinase
MEFERKADKWFVVSVDNTLYAHKYDNLIGAEVVEIAGKKIEVDTLEREVNARKNKADTKGIFTTAQYFSQHIRTGERISIIFSDKDGSSRIDVLAVPYPVIKYLHDNIPLFITALLTLLVGLFLVLKRPDNNHARMIYFVSLLIAMECLILSLLYLKNPGYDFMYFTLFFIILQFTIAYFLSSMAYFLLLFPNKHPLADNKLFVSFLFVFLPLLYLYLFFIHMIYPLYIAEIIFLCSFSMLVAAYKYITITSPDMRAQMKTIMLGIVLAFITALILFFIPIILIGRSIVSANWIMCVAVVFPAFTAVAIMRYKLMDIDTIFDNTIIYTITVLILAALDLFIIYFLTDTVLASLNMPQPLIVIFAVWIIIFAYIPVRNFVQRIIKKLLKRELYDINQVSLSLSRQMLSAADMKAAFEKATNTITDTLHPKGVEYTLVGERGSILMENKYIAESANISSYIKPVSLFEIEFLDKKLPDNYSGGALVPVVGTKGHLGYFILQDKYSQRLYDSEDMKLLSVIASQLALTLEAIRYKEELRKNEVERAKEKERLIKDIHDGLGGSLSSINILSQKGSRSDYPDEVKSLFGTLSDLSRESLFEMRNLYNIIEKKEIEWDVVITEMKNFGIFMLEPHKIELNFRYGLANDAPPSLDNLDFVNIYKIYKEAVSNIVKYSRATKVDVNMDIRKDRLILSIKDNGIGLQKGMPAPESGRGLKNMQDRAAEIGAKLEITSDNGVLIYFEKVW